MIAYVFYYLYNDFGVLFHVRESVKDANRVTRQMRENWQPVAGEVGYTNRIKNSTGLLIVHYKRKTFFFSEMLLG